jgi:Fur family ferric uptake transcriptional regulator
VSDPSERLRAHGLHVTAQRIAVLRAVERHPHRPADEIARAVRSELGTISLQGVYDALAVLSQNGLVRRLQPAGFPALFDPRATDHHHSICRSCGAVTDIDGPFEAPECLAATAAAGFEVDEAELLLWGRCRTCHEAHERART